MQIRRWPTCSLHVFFRFFSTPMRCFRKKDFAQEVSKPIWGFQAFPKRLIEKCHSLWKMWTNVDFSNNHMKRAGFHSKKNLVDGTNGANVKTNWVVHANIGPVILTYVYKCHYMRIDQYPPKYVWVWKYDKICTYSQSIQVGHICQDFPGLHTLAEHNIILHNLDLYWGFEEYAILLL